MKEYRYSKVLSIILYIVAVLIIALFSWIIIMPFVPGMEDAFEPVLYWIFVPISLGMIVFMCWGIRDTYVGKFVIYPEKILSVTAFNTIEYRLDEIKGYRENENYIFIEPKEEKKKKIKISTYYKNTHEIYDWLYQNFDNLDEIEATAEKEEILNKLELGWTQEQREESFEKAKKAAKILNWSAGIVGVWTLIFTKPYEYSVLVSIVFPVICLIVIKYFKNLLSIDERNNSAYPSIFWALFISCVSVCVRGVLDFNIFENSNTWAPAIILFITYFLILILDNNEFKKIKPQKYIVAIFISVIVFGYCYYSVIILNCMYDTSEPVKHSASVLNKEISSGKYTSYYIKLTPWATQKESEQVDVGEELYNQLEKGDTVTIYFMKGEFNIPWFIVSE